MMAGSVVFFFFFFLWCVVVAIVVVVAGGAVVGVLICRGCSTGDGGFGWIVLGVYCIEYINLLKCLYYFNVLNSKIKALMLGVL